MIILFETKIWQDIQQVCLNKFIHELTIGIYSNEERIRAYNYLYTIFCPRIQTSPYNILKPIYQTKIFDSFTPLIDSIVIWNSSFIVDKSIIDALDDNSCLISEQGIWIAIKSSQISLTQLEYLYQENITNLGFNVTMISNSIPIRSYENIIVGVQQIIEKDIDLYLSTHSDFQEIQKNVFIHPSSNIRTPVDFDTEQGKIIVGANTKISAFTTIEAPAFIGNDCLISRAYIRPKTSIGNYCRVAGELSLSTMCAYTNKAHDGCIALSHIGSWVNLGAGTECATLKYTYTPLSFEVAGKKISTNMVGCGTIFADWVSTGVGTILPPAAIIGLGTSIHIPYQLVPKYVKPFSWNYSTWKEEKWLNMANIKMQKKQLEFNSIYTLFYQQLMEKYIDI